jgi:hypothetical protein
LVWNAVAIQSLRGNSCRCTICRDDKNC